MNDQNIIYVLLAQFDPDTDPIPSEIWAFRNQIDAENFLRCWSIDYLGGYTHNLDDMPVDAELVAAFRSAGVHVHLYQCCVAGDCYELPLFASASQREAVS